MNENDMECGMVEGYNIEWYWIRMEMWIKIDFEGYVLCCDF